MKNPELLRMASLDAASILARANGDVIRHSFTAADFSRERAQAHRASDVLCHARLYVLDTSRYIETRPGHEELSRRIKP